MRTNTRLHCLLATTDAVLLDLDGVLMDSTAAVHRHWRQLAEREGLDPRQLLDDVHGRRAADVIASLHKKLSTSVAEAMRWHEDLEIRDQDGIMTLPGAADTLVALAAPQGRPFAIITSGTRKVALARIQAAGLPTPPIVVGADDVTRGKPDPEPYQRGAQLLGRTTARCLAVEDSTSGAASAVAAGCPVLGLTTTTEAARLTTSLLLPDLRPLAQALTSSQDLTSEHGPPCPRR